MSGLLRPEIRVWHRRWSYFQVCGVSGLLAGSWLAFYLVRHAGLSPGVMAGIGIAACATFLVLAMVTKILTGEERLVYYHQELAVMASAALLLTTVHQPLLPYLDITILGVGVFLACGRIGCLLVGCCYGRPCKCGVQYGREHADLGFARYLVGVRLFPVQVVESAIVFGLVLRGVLLFMEGRPAGTVLAWYTAGYGLTRFCMEFLRGDTGRSYWKGFSESQWISAFLIGGVVLAERMGQLPLDPWHRRMMVGLAIGIALIALRRYLDRTRRFRLLHPRHVKEIAGVIELASGPSIRMGSTSLGIHISGCMTGEPERASRHYAFSSPAVPLGPAAAATLANVMLQLTPGHGSPELLRGNQGVFHLLIRSAVTTGEPSR